MVSNHSEKVELKKPDVKMHVKEDNPEEESKNEVNPEDQVEETASQDEGSDIDETPSK